MSAPKGKTEIWRDFTREELLAFTEKLVSQGSFFTSNPARLALETVWDVAREKASASRGSASAALQDYIKSKTAISYERYKRASANEMRLHAQESAAFDALMASYDEARS